MCKQELKVIRNTENQENTILTSKNSKSPGTNTKGMEIYEVYDKELKTNVLKDLSELQEWTGRQLYKVRKRICEQNENTNKKLETIQNNKRESMKLKNTITRIFSFNGVT